MPSFLRAARRGLALALLATSTLAGAQSYPSRPIEWVVPYSAGGGSDVVAPTLGQALGLKVIAGSPAAMADYAAAERAKWGRVIRQNNIRVDRSPRTQ